MLSAPAGVAQRPKAQGRKTERPRPDPSQRIPKDRSTLPVIRYVQGSTVKLEQLIGDEDKELHQPTLSQTVTRYKLQGTDLGYSFDNNGSVVFCSATQLALWITRSTALLQPTLPIPSKAFDWTSLPASIVHI